MVDWALLLLLLIGWAAVLLPGALRSRNRSLHATVGGFERAMAVLRSRPDGREIMVPRQADRIVGSQARPGAGVPMASRHDPAVARRRRLFVRLLASTSAAFVLAVLFAGVFWPLFLVTAAVFGGYVALLRHLKLERDRAREVVRTIELPEPAQDIVVEREPVAVGAERYSGLQVATRPDEPWEPHAGVRIRRWDS